MTAVEPVEIAKHIRARRPELVADAGPLTEHRAALAFAERHGGELLHDHDRHMWLAFDGAIWRPEKTELAHCYARRVASDLAASSDKAGDRRTAERAAFVTGLLSLARADRAFARRSNAFDADPDLLGVPGGMVDLTTGRLLAPNPAAMITRSAAVRPTPAAECPLWLRFLAEATGGDEALIRFLQVWMGYCLTGHTTEHALVFVFGPGGNGKSVFLNVLTGILGDYAVTAAMDTFTASRWDKHPTDLAMLQGARLVTASETEEGRAWAEARIKEITGGDAITARFMRADFFTYRPQFKLTIVGNHKPVLNNVDDALRRRFNIVPFERKPDRPDRELEAKLKAEWPAILAWMIGGCLDWRAQGLVRSQSVTAATATYFSDQDLFGQWLEDECDAEPGNDHKWEKSGALFTSWSAYAKGAGEQPGTQKAFAERAKRAGLEPARIYQGRIYRGVELRRPMTHDAS